MTQLDPSCPIAPLLPYLLHINATAAEEWAEREASFVGSTLPVALVLTLGSLLLLLAGERLTRLALFLSGALVAYVAALWLSNSVITSLSASATAACVTLIAAPLVAALCGGLLTLWLLSLAFACVGLAAGAAVGQALYILVLHRVSFGVTLLGHDLFYFLLLIGLGLLGAIAMVNFKETLMIVATAALGAVGLVPGLAILLFAHADARFLWVTDISAASEHRGSPFVYGQALAVLLYFPIGVAVQRWAKSKRTVPEPQTQPYVVFHERGHFGSSAA
ncbi:hypothetical protein AB1Y20_021200 [Prymnesium parvum]|uniref:TM7S3/TM198-like domain-containing protein n=1 Tax=Prymnesium parvum TaxID=97485 RepID=A0AB34JI22_PRYPA